MRKIATDASLQELLTLLRTFLNTQQSGLESEIGTLSSLTTSTKTSLVAAINELVYNRGALSGLSTNAKNTIVAAINELVTKNGSQDSVMGALPNLTTSAKGNLVAAINELVTSLAGHTSSISTLDARTQGMIPASVQARAALLNGIYRGKNLGNFSATHAASIKAGTFDNMFLGDYFTCPAGYRNTLWGDNVFTICGFNVFNPDENNTNHIVVMPKKTITTEAFNTTATTAGGYVASHWRTNVRPVLREAAGHIFVDPKYITYIRGYIYAANSDGVITGWGWDGGYNCEIPSRGNFGFADISKINAPYECMYRKFPVFNFIHPQNLLSIDPYTTLCDPASNSDIHVLDYWGGRLNTKAANQATAYNPYLIIGENK